MHFVLMTDTGCVRDYGYEDFTLWARYSAANSKVY